MKINLQNVWVTGALVGLCACLVSLTLYGSKVLLSGDQSLQVVAAESLLAGEGVRVPDVHRSSTGTVAPGEDVRKPLAWFPPGYSLLLAGLCLAGLTVSQAAYVLFLMNKMATVILWCFVFKKWGILRWEYLALFILQSVAYMPATTTDQLLWPVAALMFLTAGEKPTYQLTIGVTILFCAAILIRWFSVVLPVVWFLWTLAFLWRKEKPAFLAFHSLVPLVFSVGFYLTVMYGLSGSFRPYPPMPPEYVKWWLLLKGVYFSVTGGFSALWSWVQISLGGLAVISLLAAGVFAFRGNGELPRWILMTALFQSCVLAFLVYTHLKAGGFFDSNVPAFATARYFAVCQPACFAVMVWVLGQVLPRCHRLSVWLPTVLLTLASLSYFVFQKQKSDDDLGICHRGFLRPTPIIALELQLADLKPDLVLLGTMDPDVLSVYTSKKMVSKSVTPVGFPAGSRIVQVNQRLEVIGLP